MIFQAVIAFCIILCIIIAILIYYSELDFTLKLVSLPFSVFFLSAFIYWVSDNLGTPVEGTPIGEFKYIHHTMKGNETIYLWIYQKEDQKHRLYQFPYTRDAAKKLAEAGCSRFAEARRIKSKASAPRLRKFLPVLPKK